MNKLGITLSISKYAIISLFLLLGSTVLAKDVSSNRVTDRDLLLLSILSYSNNQKEHINQMTNDKEFNNRWFGGYTDASELVGWTRVDEIINKSNRTMNGFSVVTYQKDDNLVISFRGTDNGIVAENWKYVLYHREHPQVKYIRYYINRIKCSGLVGKNTRIYVTGHSLGGYLAIYSLGILLHTDGLSDKIEKAVTFNALGIGYIIDKQSERFLQNVSPDKLVNYCINTDIISKIGEHYTKMISFDPVVSSSGNSNIPIGVVGNPHFPYHFLGQKFFQDQKNYK